jgi:hypothetical protein
MVWEELATRFPLKITIITTTEARLWRLGLVEQLWVLPPCITIMEIPTVMQHLRRDTAATDVA